MMRRIYLLLFLCMMVAIPLVLTGCHGSSCDDFGPEPVNAPAVREALTVKTSTTPEPSDVGSDCSEALLALVNNPPKSKAELSEALADWSARAQTHPNGAACQLGLSLVMFAAALDNVAEVAGEDLFSPDVAPVSLSFLMTLPASSGTGGLVGVYRGFFDKLSPGVRTTAASETPVLTSARMREAIRRYLLPVLFSSNGSIYNRLAPFADSGEDGPLVTLSSVGFSSIGTLNGVEITTLYTADFNLIVSGVLGLHGVSLEALAYQWPEFGKELPNYDDPASLDINGNDLLTPDEYFPPRPFGTLDPTYGKDYMRGSYDAYVEAVARALTSTKTIPDDETDLLGRLYDEMGYLRPADLPETPFDILVVVLEHFEALLDGPQALTAEYWSEGGAHEQIDLTVDLRQIFINPVRDIRNIFPNAHIVWDVDETAVQTQLLRPSYDIEVSLLDFPDLTFNGVLPNFPTVAVTVALHDYFIVVHPGFSDDPIEIGDIGDSLFDGELFGDFLR